MDKKRAIPEGYMTVGELAGKMGTTVRTLQYYDREGLLSPSSESEGGRRLYTYKDMVRLHQIQALKSLGFSLGDIKNRLISLDTPEEVAEAIVEADLVTTAVLADNFPKIAKNMAQGLKARLEAGKERINVIPCENAILCGDMLKKEILATGILTEEELDRVAAVPNTAVDRMVFGTDRDGRDGIEIGRDHELVIEKDKLTDPEKEPIKGAEYTDNLQKFLEHIQSYTSSHTLSDRYPARSVP